LRRHLLGWLQTHECERQRNETELWAQQLVHPLIVPTLYSLLNTRMRAATQLLLDRVLDGEDELTEDTLALVYYNTLMDVVAAHVATGDDGTFLTDLLDIEEGAIGVFTKEFGLSATALASALGVNFWREIIVSLTTGAPALLYPQQSAGVAARIFASLSVNRKLIQILTTRVNTELVKQIGMQHPAVMAAELTREQMQALGMSKEDVAKDSKLSMSMVSKMLSHSTRPRSTWSSARVASLALTRVFAERVKMDWAVLYLSAISVELAPAHVQRHTSGRLHRSRYANVNACLTHLRAQKYPAPACARIQEIADGVNAPATGDFSWQQPFRQLLAYERGHLGL
jgi:hypothetical protein